jgi:hypothetical protein
VSKSLQNYVRTAGASATALLGSGLIVFLGAPPVNAATALQTDLAWERSSDDPQPPPTPNFSPDQTSGSSASLSGNKSNDGQSSGIDLSPPIITRDDVTKALLCGLSVAKIKIPDKDLQDAIDVVLTGRSMAEVRNNLGAMFVKLGIGLTTGGECFAPYLEPPPVGG